MRKNLAGVFCPITTPFIEETVAIKKLGENIEKFNSTGLSGLVVLGSTGEAVHLNLQEKIRIIQTARNYLAGDKILIVGTGHQSTYKTIEFTKQVADLGADYALVLTPHYYKSDVHDDGFYRHYVTVADQAPIPILLYNVPKFTGINLNIEVVKKLAIHPNIQGIKDSYPMIAQLVELITLNCDTFQVLVGSDTLFLAGIFLGAAGAILALANVLPEECVYIYQNVISGDYEAAKRKFFEILPLARALTGKYGIPAIKAVLDMIGYFGGQPRSPLQPLTQDQKQELQNLIHRIKTIN